MAYYLISYDASVDEYPDALKDIVGVLFENFDVYRLGRPIASTLLFEVDAEKWSIEEIAVVIKGHFERDFGFVLSRVSYRDKEHKVLIVPKQDQELCNNFDDVLEELKDEGRICDGVENIGDIFNC